MSEPIYKLWSQSDVKWGSRSIGGSNTMSGQGCLVTAVAKILVHSGQQNENAIDPGKCLDYMFEYGVQNKTTGSRTGDYNTTGFLPKYGPELKWEKSDDHAPWEKAFGIETIKARIENGYYVIVCVKTGAVHFMAVDRVENGIIYAMDNGKVIDLYKERGLIIDQVYFKYNGKKSYPAYSFNPYAVNLSVSPTTGTVKDEFVFTAQTGGEKAISMTFTVNGGLTAADKTVSNVLTNGATTNDGGKTWIVKGLKLSVGTVTLTSTAKYSATKSVVSDSVKITVTDAVPSALSIGSVKTIPDITQGWGIDITGAITSNYKITSVTVGVYSAISGGTAHTEAKATPNATSYNISSLNASVKFGVVPVGTKYFRVTAADASGTTTTLVNQSFKVSEANKEDSTLKISSAKTIPDIKKGWGIDITGAITSNYKITSVTVGIYSSSSGGTAHTQATATPNATSYNISSLNASVKFGVVPVGTQYFRVTASDASPITKTLINQSFKVST